MKKTKIIIPTLGLLLLSTAASVSSTVAWFSMNKSVTANGLQITAKSDDTFLLISKTNSTASAIQTEGLKAVSLVEESASIYASAPCLTSGEASALNTTTGKKVGEEAITVAGAQVTNLATAEVFTNWYTANAAAPTASAKEANSERQLTAFTNYVIVETLYLTVASGSNPANNLKLTPTITQVGEGADVTAVKFLIATSDNGFYAVSNANNGSELDIKGSNTNITDSTVLTVKVFAYYDGNESVVYTKNIANLTGATIDLSFSVTSNPTA